MNEEAREYGACISGVVIIALVSKVHLLVLLSNFARCWVTRESIVLVQGSTTARQQAL